MEDTKFKKEVNDWIIELNRRTSSLPKINTIISEQEVSIDHNYELICEMRTDIKKLQEDVATLRVIQLLAIKQELKELQSQDKIEESHSFCDPRSSSLPPK